MDFNPLSANPKNFAGLALKGLLIKDYLIFRKRFNRVSFPNFRYAKINLRKHFRKTNHQHRL